MQAHRTKIIASAIIVAIVVGLIFTITRGERSRDLVLKVEPFGPGDDVTIYVSGAVESPGLISLPRGSRLAEALDIAGLDDSADTSALQLASVLDDEQTIVVPHLAPQQSQPTEEDQTTSLPESTSTSIDINEADAAELERLPGIGPAIADRIIEHREQVGRFKSLDDLSEVSGISDRMIDEFRDLATAGS